MVSYQSNISFFGGGAQQPPVGHGLLILEVSRSHSDTPHSVGLPGRVIRTTRRPLPDNTQHSQETNIHASGGIWTHDLSSRAAADLRLRQRGHWDRHFDYLECLFKHKTYTSFSVTSFSSAHKPSSDVFHSNPTLTDISILYAKVRFTGVSLWRKSSENGLLTNPKRVT